MPDPVHPNAPTDSDRLATRGAALATALEALDRLAALGEDVEDEWTYVTALADAGRTRLRTAAGTDRGAALAPVRSAAVAAAAAEAARIADPHRAIDWLSTFPAVVELALADAPAASPEATAADAPAASPGPTGRGA